MRLIFSFIVYLICYKNPVVRKRGNRDIQSDQNTRLLLTRDVRESKKAFKINNMH